MQRTLPHSKPEDIINYVQRKQGLMLTADCSLQVRNNQVPKPRAMVEDILARVTLLNAELGMHMGPVPPPSPTSSVGSPHATSSGSQVPYMHGLHKRGASSIAPLQDAHPQHAGAQTFEYLRSTGCRMEGLLACMHHAG